MTSYRPLMIFSDFGDDDSHNKETRSIPTKQNKGKRKL